MNHETKQACTYDCACNVPTVKLPVKGLSFTFDASELKEFCKDCGGTEPIEPIDPIDPPDEPVGPSTSEVTLLGGAKNDQFINIFATDDGYIAQGNYGADNNGSISNTCVVKYDKNFNLLRQVAVYHSNFQNDSPSMSAIQTSDGGVIAAGYHAQWNSTPRASHKQFDKDLNLVKTSFLNNGPTHRNLCKVPAVFQGSATYITCGHTSNYQGLIVTYDQDLNPLKATCITGGTSIFYDIIATENAVIAVGQCNSTSGAGNNDALIVMFDDILSNTPIKIQLIGAAEDECLNKIIKTSNGFLTVGYRKNPTTSMNDILLLMFDEKLNVTKKALIAGNGNDVAKTIAINARGNYMLCGETTSAGAGGTDAFLIEVDHNLNIIRDLVVGGSEADRGLGLLCDINSNYIIAGSTSVPGAGNADGMLLRIKGDWADLVGGTAKYPPLRINPRPGFVINTDFALILNVNTTLNGVDYTATTVNTTDLLIDYELGLTVDANATIAI